jgi:8-oxo-dGTP diphosphatase
MTRRNIEPFKGMWCLAGGHIDPYELAADAVVREVKEETGLDFQGEFFRYFDETYPELNIHNVVMIFVGTGTGTPRRCEREVQEIAWMPLQEAADQPLAFGHEKVLQAVIAQGVS